MKTFLSAEHRSAAPTTAYEFERLRAGHAHRGKPPLCWAARRHQWTLPGIFSAAHGTHDRRLSGEIGTPPLSAAAAKSATEDNVE